MVLRVYDGAPRCISFTDMEKLGDIADMIRTSALATDWRPLSGLYNCWKKLERK